MSGEPDLPSLDEDESKINRISGWRYLALWPLSIIVRLWCASMRIRISPDEAKLLSDTSQPMVIIFWHNRLLMGANVYRRFRRNRRVTGLVSASKDGAWLAAFFSLMNVDSVRGSSSARTLGATRDLLNCLNNGSDIAVTPDGPRGPCYEFKPGAVRVAKQAETPIMLVSGSIEKFRRLKSWDGFYLPMPFTGIEIRVTHFHSFSALGATSDEEAAQILRRELMLISHDP